MFAQILAHSLNMTFWLKSVFKNKRRARGGFGLQNETRLQLCLRLPEQDPTHVNCHENQQQQPAAHYISTNSSVLLYAWMDESPCVVAATWEMYGDLKYKNKVIENNVDNPELEEVKVSWNGPERRSGKIIIAGTAFRLEFLVSWYYDTDATMAVPELY